MQIKLEERGSNNYLRDYKKEWIHDGDIFGMRSWDFLGPMLMYGAGSRTSHNTMALHFDDELYIVESEPKGIIRTKWDDWIDKKVELSYDIVHMPLRQDLSEKFDAEKARQFFAETEGLPYGFHTFIYGWLDTPRDNLPPLLSNEFLPIMFSMIETTNPEVSDMVFTSGLNMRLGTEGLNIA
jgi:hypothetical protein